VSRSARAFSVVIPYLASRSPESSLPGCVVPGVDSPFREAFVCLKSGSFSSVDSMPGKRIVLRVVPRFGFQFRGRSESSSWCAGRAYGALRAGNRDPGSGLLWACRGLPTMAGAGYTCGPGPEPPVPYSESWSNGCHDCEMKSSNRFIPTTAHTSSGPFMDIPSRRR